MGKFDIPDAIGWLDGASSDLLDAIRSRADQVSYPSDYAHIRIGDSAGGIVAIISGRMDYYLTDVREGRELCHVFGPGWWLGGLAAISGEDRIFEHRTGLPTELLRLSKIELERICEEFPDAWQRMAFMAAASMRIAISVAVQYRLPNPTMRIASTLNRLHTTGPGWGGRLPISQAELASIADMSRRRVITALETLERTGAIKREYGAVQILDTELLKAAAGLLVR